MLKTNLELNPSHSLSQQPNHKYIHRTEMFSAKTNF